MVKMEDIQICCEKMIATDRVSTMLICIHGKRGEEPCGEILNCYMEGPVAFYNVGDLVLKLDEICDWIGTPHPSTEPRFLNHEMEKQYRSRMEGKSNVPVKAKIRLLDSSLLISRAVKARQTLLVKIEFRQYSSFQGRVQGKLTRGEFVGFRSALELMRMVRELAMTDESAGL
ncbi:hypothetical protein AALB39_18705 [Lachnospiraceae bacterium 54-53]